MKKWVDWRWVWSVWSCCPLVVTFHLGKTTGWQHRFSDLTILSPIWLGTYEYMKSTLENFFFFFETGLPEWIFQIWSKIFKSDRVFVYMKKSLFWAFLGPPKVSRPLGITKEGPQSVKVQEIRIRHVSTARSSWIELYAKKFTQQTLLYIFIARTTKHNFL